MNNPLKGVGLSRDTERAEQLRKVIEDLQEANKATPVIVEGRRDADALRQLGCAGEIIVLHNGKGLFELTESIAEKFEKVILLADWDNQGESLNKKLGSHLEGRWEKFSKFRERLKILCQKDIRDIEGIPKLLRSLESNERYWQRR